jgi:hypothetical protein
VITPKVTICVLLYGDYPGLARQSLESIRRNCSPSEYRLVVGANAIENKTLGYVESLRAEGAIDHLILSQVNLNKCPMMRRMLDKVETEFIWWFDDDSHVVELGALDRWLGSAGGASDRTVMWGQLAWCDHPPVFGPDLHDAVTFVRRAAWYRGLPPPSWRAGGKGEFDFHGLGSGDGRWYFVLGGCWLIRTRTVRALDWPDRRLIKMGDDVFLGEAIRQNGWELGDIGTPGVALNTELRRGDPGRRRTP